MDTSGGRFIVYYLARIACFGIVMMSSRAPLRRPFRVLFALPPLSLVAPFSYPSSSLPSCNHNTLPSLSDCLPLNGFAKRFSSLVHKSTNYQCPSRSIRQLTTTGCVAAKYHSVWMKCFTIFDFTFNCMNAILVDVSPQFTLLDGFVVFVESNGKEINYFDEGKYTHPDK